MTSASRYKLSLDVQSANGAAYYLDQLLTGSFILQAKGDRDKAEACMVMHQKAPEEIVSDIRAFIGNARLSLAASFYQKINDADLGFNIDPLISIEVKSGKVDGFSIVFQKNADGSWRMIKWYAMSGPFVQDIAATIALTEIAKIIKDFFAENALASQLYEKINAADLGFTILYS